MNASTSIHKKNHPRRSSLCDIVKDTKSKVPVHELELLVKTGDMMLYGNSLRDPKLLWYTMVAGFQGRDSMEQAIPVLHCAMIVKNPPMDIIDLYGLSTKTQPNAESEVYVWESTSGSPNGPRLVRFQEWVKYELDPAFPGGHLFHRPLESSGSTLGIQEENLWNWIRTAKNIQYYPPTIAAAALVTWRAGVERHGALHGWISTGAKVITVWIETRLGSYCDDRMEQNHFAKQILSWVICSVARLLLALKILLFLSIAAVIHISMTKNFRKYSGINDAASRPASVPEYLCCSTGLAATMMRAGILAADAPWESYCPKDFLPSFVDAPGSLCDEHMKEGLWYSDQLIQVVQSTLNNGKDIGEERATAAREDDDGNIRVKHNTDSSELVVSEPNLLGMATATVKRGRPGKRTIVSLSSSFRVRPRWGKTVGRRS